MDHEGCGGHPDASFLPSLLLLAGMTSQKEMFPSWGVGGVLCEGFSLSFVGTLGHRAFKSSTLRNNNNTIFFDRTCIICSVHYLNTFPYYLGNLNILRY